MSRRHMHLARALHGVRVLKENEIWNTAVMVWNDLPSCKIANAFVLAKRIAEMIVERKGDNDFLCCRSDDLSSRGRVQLIDTLTGNKRRDGKKMLSTNYNNYVVPDVKATYITEETNVQQEDTFGDCVFV